MCSIFCIFGIFNLATIAIFLCCCIIKNKDLIELEFFRNITVKTICAIKGHNKNQRNELHDIKNKHSPFTTQGKLKKVTLEESNSSHKRSHDKAGMEDILNDHCIVVIIINLLP